MVTLNFRELFRLDRLGTEQEGEQHFKVLRGHILSTSPSENILFDLSEMRVFGQSYAKQTLGILYDGLRSGAYEGRHFFICMKKPILVQEQKNPTKGNLFEVHSAMQKVDLPALVTFDRGGAEFYNHYRVVGSLQDNLLRVLQIIVARGEVTTAYLSRFLNESLQSSSTKLRRLEELKLIRKAIPLDRKGNVFSYRRLEVQ